MADDNKTPNKASRISFAPPEESPNRNTSRGFVIGFVTQALNSVFEGKYSSDKLRLRIDALLPENERTKVIASSTNQDENSFLGLKMAAVSSYSKVAFLFDFLSTYYNEILLSSSQDTTANTQKILEIQEKKRDSITVIENIKRLLEKEWGKQAAGNVAATNKEVDTFSVNLKAMIQLLGEENIKDFIKKNELKFKQVFERSHAQYNSLDDDDDVDLIVEENNGPDLEPNKLEKKLEELKARLTRLTSAIEKSGIDQSVKTDLKKETDEINRTLTKLGSEIPASNGNEGKQGEILSALHGAELAIERVEKLLEAALNEDIEARKTVVEKVQDLRPKLIALEKAINKSDEIRAEDKKAPIARLTAFVGSLDGLNDEAKDLSLPFDFAKAKAVFSDINREMPLIQQWFDNVVGAENARKEQIIEEKNQLRNRADQLSARAKELFKAATTKLPGGNSVITQILPAVEKYIITALNKLDEDNNNWNEENRNIVLENLNNAEDKINEAFDLVNRYEQRSPFRVADYVDPKNENHLQSYEQLYTGITKVYPQNNPDLFPAGKMALYVAHTFKQADKNWDEKIDVGEPDELGLVKKDPDPGVDPNQTPISVSGPVTQAHLIAQLIDRKDDFVQAWKKQKTTKATEKILQELKASKESGNAQTEITQTFKTIEGILVKMDSRATVSMSRGSPQKRFDVFHDKGAKARVLHLVGTRSLIETISYAIDYKIREMEIGIVVLSPDIHTYLNGFTVTSTTKVHEILSALIANPIVRNEEHSKLCPIIMKFLFNLKDSSELSSHPGLMGAHLEGLQRFIEPNTTYFMPPSYPEVLERINWACRVARLPEQESLKVELPSSPDQDSGQSSHMSPQ